RLEISSGRELNSSAVVKGKDQINLASRTWKRQLSPIERARNSPPTPSVVLCGKSESPVSDEHAPSRSFSSAYQGKGFCPTARCQTRRILLRSSSQVRSV